MGDTAHTGIPTSLMSRVLVGDAPFPDPELANAEGLVALGGRLSVKRLVEAYGRGVFPWSVEPVTWWSPDPRAIIDLDNLHVSRSLQRVLRQDVFTTTTDKAFRKVIEACARAVRSDGSTWISSGFIEAYCRLHKSGHAHSVECWQGKKLVGGIYGVSVGGLFAGESMFRNVSNASKVALVRLVEHLKEQGFKLFDIQMLTPVTQAMGAMEIPRAEYLIRLRSALKQTCVFN